MPEVYVIADNIVSPLGNTTMENMARLTAGNTGIALHNDPLLSEQPFYASLIARDHPYFSDKKNTRFENLLIASISDVLQSSGVHPGDEGVLLIVSSTKGNIELLEEGIQNDKKIALHTSAKKIAGHFGFVNTPVVISNACISGLMAMLVAKRLLSAQRYHTAVVVGADVISKFILSGFQSFQAIGTTPCRPFDAERDGITLGEGAAAVVLSVHKGKSGTVKVIAGGASNDANHISAPSRTGEELAHIIKASMQNANLTTGDIGFISAHGTATRYNDDMEAKAITAAGLISVPVNSLKGYFGHTLGAAGLIESIVSIHAMQQNFVLPTRGFDKAEEGMLLTITSTLQQIHAQYILKTASGFGGCNAALVFGKTIH